MKGQLKKVTGVLLFFLRGIAVMCLCAALLSAQTGGITAKDPDAKKAMDAAHKALGGADKIGGIESFVIKGTQSLTRAAGYVSPISGTSPKPSTSNNIEIRILLPDSFLNIIGVTQIYQGVSQGKLIPSLPVVSTAIVTGPDGKDLSVSPEIAAARARDMAVVDNHRTTERMDEWARFLLGTLMKAGSTQLTISSGSKPNLLTLTKTDGAALGEMEFDSKTGYPSVIRYRKADAPQLERGVLVGGIGGDMRGGGLFGGLGTVNDEIWFQDRFSVNGIMFPRIITTIDAESMVIFELRIEEVQINPKLSLKDFEMP